MGIDGFMFHDMLYWHTALLGHPGSSLVYAAHFNPIYPKLTALYNSPLSSCTYSLSLLILLSSVSVYVFLYISLPLPPFFLSSSLSPLLLHLTTLLRSSGLRRHSPCAPWRCGSCLNGTALIFACMPSPPRSTMLGRNCALSSVLLIKRTVSILFYFFTHNGV